VLIAQASLIGDRSGLYPKDLNNRQRLEMPPTSLLEAYMAAPQQSFRQKTFARVERPAGQRRHT
jgi:hypothetical protein